MKYLIVALGSIFLASLAQVLLKLAAISMETPVSICKDSRLYLGGLLLMLAFVGWIIAASKIEFSRLIPMNALSLVISGVVGVWLFGETITKAMMLAYLLIVIAVSVLMFAKP